MSEKEGVSVTFYARKDVKDYADFLADLMELSRSDVINDVFKNMMDADLEEEIWGDAFTDAKKEFDEMAESVEESETESESEEEEEEEE